MTSRHYLTITITICIRVHAEAVHTQFPSDQMREGPSPRALIAVPPGPPRPRRAPPTDLPRYLRHIIHRSQRRRRVQRRPSRLPMMIHTMRPPFVPSTPTRQVQTALQATSVDGYDSRAAGSARFVVRYWWREVFGWWALDVVGVMWRGDMMRAWRDSCREIVDTLGDPWCAMADTGRPPRFGIDDTCRIPRLDVHATRSHPRRDVDDARRHYRVIHRRARRVPIPTRCGLTARQSSTCAGHVWSITLMIASERPVPAFVDAVSPETGASVRAACHHGTPCHDRPTGH